MTQYLRNTLLGGVFLLPFIPFLIAESLFFPFITGKTFAFRIIVEALLGLYVILALAEPAYRPKRSWLLWAVGAFVLSAGIATVLSVDPLKSFWSNFERMEGYVGLLHLAAYFLVAGAVLSTEKLWTRFFQVSVLASAIMGVYVLMQLAGFVAINQGGVRTDGTFGNATYLAVYMLFHLFFTLFLLAREKTSWVQGLYYLALILQAVALFFTATRGAMLGLILGILLTALLVALFERERKGLRKVALGAIAAVMVTVGVFFAVKDLPAVVNHPVLSRFSEISLSEGTVKARFLVWNMALQGFTEKPLFGWGQENFSIVFNKYYNPQMYAQEQWFDRAHNSFLDWLIAGGLATFLSYAALFVLALYAVLRSRLAFTEKAILTGLIAAYAFHLSFVFDNLVSAYYFFTLLAFAHFLSKRELPRSLMLTKPVRGTAFSASAAGIALVTLFGAWSLNAPGIAAAQDLLAAITPTKPVAENGAVSRVPKTTEETLADFREAFSHGELGVQEATEQVLQAASVLASQNVDPQAKQEFFDYAYERGVALLAERPGDARLELFFGAFLNNWRRHDEALAHLERAHELSPGKQGILFEIGVNSYLNTGKYEEGARVLKEAYELAPDYREAAMLYTVSLHYEGKRAEADAFLKEKYGGVILDDSRLLKAYFDAKLYDRVVAIWQVRVDKEPLNLQLRVSLAAAYLAAGDRAGAIRTLREAIKVEPRFAAQGEKFIAEIEAGRTP